MTTLQVKPLDPTQPGSYRERKALIKLIRLFDRATGDNDVMAWADAVDALDEFLLPRLSTDDEIPVEDVLSRLSADQFDELIQKVSFGSDAVPEANGGSSPSGAEGGE